MIQRILLASVALTAFLTLRALLGCGGDNLSPINSDQVSDRQAATDLSEASAAAECGQNRTRRTIDAKGELIWYGFPLLGVGECLSYEYDNETLKIIHSLALPEGRLDSLYVDFSITRGVIRITEHFDLDVFGTVFFLMASVRMEVRDLPPGEYLIIADPSPYAEPVRWRIDLTSEPSAKWCARPYPWSPFGDNP